MDHYSCLGCTSTPRALKDSLNLGPPTALVQSTRAVGFPRFKLPLSARGVVKCSLTEHKSIVKTLGAMLDILKKWLCQQAQNDQAQYNSLRCSHVHIKVTLTLV